MTKEEWEASNSASDMLSFLNRKNRSYMKSLIPSLHRYFLACCWNIKHLIPQKHLRNGLKGAQKWIEGEIGDEELYRLNRSAEAVCFAFDDPEDGEEIRDMDFDEEKHLLKRAAYFAEISMVYPKINHAPYVKSMCNSQFVCADLLREYVVPNPSIFDR